MFENLSEKLERSFKVLKGQGKITEINVAETLKEVRRALLDADVNYKVAKQFTDTVKAKAMGQDVINALKPSELMVKIVHDELALLMGGEQAEFKIEGKPAIILMSGLHQCGGISADYFDQQMVPGSMANDRDDRDPAYSFHCMDLGFPLYLFQAVPCQEAAGYLRRQGSGV